MDALETILAYHDKSKHHPHRYAAGPSGLDWPNQPDPFRRFDGAPLVRLPLPRQDDTPPYELIYRPGAILPASLTLESLSRFLECSLALSAWKVYGDSRWSLRVNPSSGNLHPTEGYLVLGDEVPQIEGPGIYHYAPGEHALERRCSFSRETWRALMSPFPAGAFLVGLSSIHWREAWKYGERAFRYCQHDVGHALGALRVAAGLLGWQLFVLEGLSDRQVASLLGLDRRADFAEAEPEEPELIAAVCPPPEGAAAPRLLPAEALTAVAGSEWAGRANPLSAQAVKWEAIGLAARATVKPATTVAPCRFPGTRPAPPAAPTPTGRPTSRDIILQRRSGTAYDGRTGMSAGVFYRMLGRLVPRAEERGLPWDCISWSPRIHLLLFVHLIESLTPGLYALVRDGQQADRLREALKEDFAWTSPPGCPDQLPLYKLRETDCRRTARQLSLGQDIAGSGAFSLAMVADFDSSLRESGAWFYRRLFWEAGLIGQVLYLEAEAAGLRGTGIGAYFDDKVHKRFGLAGRRFQSLYHFAVGGPIEDPRLTTQPPYPAANG